MPARLPPDLLDRSAEESSRLLALYHLDQIDRAQRRLIQALEPEALHDFRVGLRRLRSCIRAYRAQLKGSVTGKARDRLRELTRATNPGRDAEVALIWLREQAGRLGPEDASGLFWFTGRLEGRKHDMLDPATAQAGRKYLKTVGKLRRKLGILEIEVGPNPPAKPATFGQVTGGLIRQEVIRLREDLKLLRDVSQIEEAHQARISVKRLRYLLEPVARRERRARALIPRLKEGQDLLGKHHDMRILADEIASARSGLPGSNGAGLAGLEHGLATLERLAVEEASASFQRFQSLWNGEREGRTITRVDEIASSLVEGSGDREISATIVSSGQPAAPAANQFLGRQ
jgi:CHAD domain-containing protein